MTLNTRVVATASRVRLALGHRYARMVMAKMRAYMAHASVFPIQKNQPVKNATGFGRVRLVNE